MCTCSLVPMLCVFTGPILSWSQAQLLIEREKKTVFLLRWHLFSSADLSVWLWLGSPALLSQELWHPESMYFICINSSFHQIHLAASVNVSSNSSRTDRGSRSRLTFDHITWVLIQHFFNFQFQSNKHIYIHFSWPVLGWLMQCNTTLLTGEQRGESIVFLAVFIECSFCKKKTAKKKITLYIRTTMMSVGINSHLISSALEMERQLQLNSWMTSHTMVGGKKALM